MADPLSTASALLGLVTFSYQASKALHDAIQSYRQHPKYVRDLGNELSALEGVLLLLEQTLSTSGPDDYALLEVPVRRCGHACEEFTQALRKCSRPDKADGSSFRGWLRIRWMGSDINGFKDTLSGYKSTIAIAIAGVNLRTNKASLQVIQEYKEMIQSTATDLKDHLYDMDNKLSETDEDRYLPEDPIDRMTILAERESTMKSLEICRQVSRFIEERQKSMVEDVAAIRDPDAQANHGAESSSPWQIMEDSLQGCKFNIKSANAQLSNRLRYLSTTLSNASPDVLQASSDRVEERDEMRKEIESVRQCLDICMQAEEDADKARTNIMEDITTGEDSRQILVSTVGDLIAAHRITAGCGSLQAIGQMSDETLQQISRTHRISTADLVHSAAEPHQGRDAQAGAGRTLGSSNVRTL